MKYSFKWVQVNDSLILRPSCTHWVKFEIHGGWVGGGGSEVGSGCQKTLKVGEMEIDNRQKTDNEKTQFTIFIYFCM